MRFVKGHGTHNDFVVLPDLDNTLTLDDATVRALCDRRGGIGGDGVLRVVRRSDDDVRWFMDYRNADGSLAEMCGNGIRVFARYLVTERLEEPGRFAIATRAGDRIVDVPADGGDITVAMGPATKLADAKVRIGGIAYDARGWSLGNPHLVALDVDDIDGTDLSKPPTIEPAVGYEDGVNVEIVRRDGATQITMRVHERGAGETHSCGTGACAAAVAAMEAAGERTTYDVDVPGGRLRVRWDDDGEVTLTGPAVLVASGEYRGDT